MTVRSWHHHSRWPKTRYNLLDPAIFALVFWIVVWACVARAEPITGPYVLQPPLTAPVDQAYMRIDPSIKPQLDRIEKMLRAICEHSRHANGMFLNDDCPQEPIP